MTDFLYLGSCLYEPKPYTRVVPLAVAEDGCWRRYVEWTQALPPEGRAFAPSLQGFHDNDLVTFRLTPSDRADEGRDKYLVASPTVPVEVLDYRAVDAEAARRALVEEGLPRSGDSGRRVIVALRDGAVCLKLVRHPDGARDIAATDGLDELALHAIDVRFFDGDRIRERFYAVPGETLGPQIGVVNWCLDTDFLKAVLSRLRRAAGGGFPFNRSQVEQLVQMLVRARLAPSNGEDLRPTTERLGRFTATLEQGVSGLDGLIDAVAALRPVANGLAERRSALEVELRADLGRRVRSELEAQEGDLSRRRDVLAAEVATLEQAATAARGQAATAESDLATARGLLGEATADLLDQLAQAQGAVAVRPAATELARRLHTVPEIWPAAAAPWSRRRDGEFEPIVWADLSQRLAESAEAFGFVVEDLVFADVAVRSGRIALLPEADAAAFVRCHAGALAGGRWTRHVLDPAVLSADDLWRRPLTSEPTAFSLAWTAAKLDPRAFEIVLLDGVNRTPMDLWGAGFVDILSSEARPSNLLVFACFGSELLDASRAWDGVTREMVGFEPLRSALNAEVLGRTVGRAMRATRLDATAAPAVADADLLRHVASMTTLSGTQAACALAAVRAASPLAPGLDPDRIARVFGSGADAPDGMRRGAERARLSLAPAKP